MTTTPTLAGEPVSKLHDKLTPAQRGAYLDGRA